MAATCSWLGSADVAPAAPAGAYASVRVQTAAARAETKTLM